MRVLIFLAFISSCGPLKLDTASACPVDRAEAVEALDIASDMAKSGESCDAIQDFLLDTALDHNIEWSCE